MPTSFALASLQSYMLCCPCGARKACDRLPKVVGWMCAHSRACDKALDRWRTGEEAELLQVLQDASEPGG